MTLQIYRGTTLGIALEETLTEMLEKGIITLDLSKRIKELFDMRIQEELLKHLPVESHLSIQADQISSYRYFDQVWSFVLNDLNIKPLGWVKKLRIISCDSQIVATPGTQKQPSRDRRLDGPKTNSVKKQQTK